MIQRYVCVLLALTLLVLWQPAPSFAEGVPTLTIVSPKNGDRITSTDIPIQVSVTNFNLDCLKYGRPDEPGTGHVHALIDGTTLGNLIDFYCTPTFTISGEGLSPGTHQLLIDLATNTHADLPTTATQISFDYEPTTPPPVPAPSSATPTVQLVGITDGETIGPELHFSVVATNFQPSAALEGKPLVPGWGHYHVWIDMPPLSPSGGMSSLAGLVAMPGTNDITVDLTAWPSGQHRLTFDVAQNDHMPYPGVPPITLTFTLNNPAVSAVSTDPMTSMPTNMPKSGGDPYAFPEALLGSALLLVVGIGLRRPSRGR